MPAVPAEGAEPDARVSMFSLVRPVVAQGSSLLNAALEQSVSRYDSTSSTMSMVSTQSTPTFASGRRYPSQGSSASGSGCPEGGVKLLRSVSQSGQNLYRAGSSADDADYAYRGHNGKHRSSSVPAAMNASAMGARSPELSTTAERARALSTSTLTMNEAQIAMAGLDWGGLSPETHFKAYEAESGDACFLTVTYPSLVQLSPSGEVRFLLTLGNPLT